MTAVHDALAAPVFARRVDVLGTENAISIATSLDDLDEALVKIAAAAKDRDGFQSYVRDGRLV